jgi:hypothetical protein
MRTAALAIVVTGSATALGETPAAVDLSRIDRKISQEPEYRTKSPKYCLLVFGPEAKTRVWLVVDGDTLRVSGSDGDLTGPASQVINRGAGGFTVGEVTEIDGKTKHTGLRLSRLNDTWRIDAYLAGSGRSACRRQGAGYDPDDKLVFSDRPADAPIVHFNGPRTLQVCGKPTLDRGDNGTMIKVGFGTPGLGRGTFAAFQGCAVPEKHELTADIEFPTFNGEDKITTRTVIGNNH